MKRFLNKIKGSKFYFKVLAISILVSLTIIGVNLNSYSSNINENLSNNLIRLHVIANSNSNSDQNLKIKVRDFVIKHIKEFYIESDNIQQTQDLILKNLENINIAVNNFLAESDTKYMSKVYLGMFEFPTKYYENISLPAGEYNSLRIVLGEGEGENWWCVLFPPLCFVDSTHGEIPKDMKSTLEKKLPKEEFDIITKGNSGGDIPIRLKFKIVEIFSGTKTRIASFSKRFGK